MTKITHSITVGYFFVEEYHECRFNTKELRFFVDRNRQHEIKIVLT